MLKAADAAFAAVIEDLLFRAGGLPLALLERAAISAALRAAGGNRRLAAARLGIGERTLYRKVRQQDDE